MFIIRALSNLFGASDSNDLSISESEEERFPYRWDRNLLVFDMYLDLPRPKRFIQRVFLGQGGNPRVGAVNAPFQSHVGYIHDMVMAGFMYIWKMDDQLQIRNIALHLEEYRIDSNRPEEYTRPLFEKMAREIQSPEDFLVTFHQFVWFYQSYRYQHKHSLFSTLDLPVEWKVLMDLFWMVCMSCPSDTTQHIADWIQSLQNEIPFLLVFYSLVMYSYQQHQPIPQTILSQFEDALVDMVEQQNGRTGFEQIHPTLSSLETRLKRQFPEEPLTPDVFDVAFIERWLSSFQNRPARSPFHQYVQSSPSPSRSPLLSPHVKQDLMEVAYSPDRLPQMDMVDTVTFTPDTLPPGWTLNKYGVVFDEEGNPRSRPYTGKFLY